MITALLSKVGSSVATGFVGAVAYDGAKKAVRTGTAREGAVTALAWGLRGKRQAEVRAERLRLATGDLVADARGRVGEQAPPPTGPEAHDHEH